MKKVLLIEDITKRQSNIKLEPYKEVLDNSIEDNYLKTYNSLKDDSFDFSKYDIILCHKSAFFNDVAKIISKLENYCNDTQTSLVLFSGGIDTSSYFNNNYEQLSLNDADFYSENLTLFLDEYKKDNKNILILLFGTRWKLNIILNVFDKMNYFIGINKDKKDIVYSKFVTNTEINLLDNLDIEFYKMEIEDNWVYMSEIIKLRDDIKNKIEELVDE